MVKAVPVLKHSQVPSCGLRVHPLENKGVGGFVSLLCPGRDLLSGGSE